MRSFKQFPRFAVVLSVLGLVLGTSSPSRGPEYCPITGARIGLGSQGSSVFSRPPAFSVPPPTNVVPQAQPTPGNSARRSSVSPPKNAVPPANAQGGQRLVGPTGRTEGFVPGSAPATSGHVPPPKNTVPTNKQASNPNGQSRQQASSGRTPARTPPPRNFPLSQSVVHLTPSNVQEIHRQLQAQQSLHLNNLKQQIGAAGADNQHTASQQALNRVGNRMKTGQATGKGFADLVGGIQKSPPGGTRNAALNEAGKMAVNQQVADWLNGKPIGAVEPGSAAALAKNNAGGAGSNALRGSGMSNSAMAGPGPERGAPNGKFGVSGSANYATGPGSGTPNGKFGGVSGQSIGGGPGAVPDALRGTGVSNGAMGAGAQAGAGTGMSNPAGGGAAAGAGTGVSNPAMGGARAGSGLGMSNGAMTTPFGGAGPWAGPGRWGRQGRWGGGRMALGLIPGLPAGMMIPLDGDSGGAMLVGMGQPGDQIVIGDGDPDLAAGLSVAPSDALPARASAGPVADGDVIVGNAADSAVSYTINQNPYTMQPAFEQTLAGGNSWVVEFDRGNGAGTARYQLARGYYRFRYGDSGWDLFKTSFQTTLENGSGLPSFSYVIDDQPQSLPEGQFQEITGDYPPVVRFEDGAGQTKQRRLDGPAYRVALSNDRTLDIYPVDAFQASPESPPPGPAQSGPPQPGQPVADDDSDTPPPPPTDLPNPGEAPSKQVAADPATRTTRETRATVSPDMTLPKGFRLFDPVAALTEPEVGQSLPPAFTLFRAAAAAKLEDKDKSG